MSSLFNEGAYLTSMSFCYRAFSVNNGGTVSWSRKKIGVIWKGSNLRLTDYKSEFLPIGPRRPSTQVTDTIRIYITFSRKEARRLSFKIVLVFHIIPPLKVSSHVSQKTRSKKQEANQLRVTRTVITAFSVYAYLRQSRSILKNVSFSNDRKPYGLFRSSNITL